jgi:PAS domain S-box-containing protein
MASDRLYRELFSRIFDPCALYRIQCGPDGNPLDALFLDVNPAYEASTGIRREDLLGKPFLDVWGRAEREWRDLILKVARSGESEHYEGPNRDTGKYYFALAFCPSPGHVAVVFMDVTERRRDEELLREKQRQLEEYRGELRSLATRLSLAEEETRREIATHLHDRFGYDLVLTLHQLQEVEGVPALPAEAGKRVAEVRRLLERLLQDTRSFTLQISPPLLYEVGLEAAIGDLGDRLFPIRNIAFDFQEPSHSLDLERPARVLLYQMVRELFLNVLKHSGAQKVQVRLRRAKDKIVLVVEDDGIGFRFADRQEPARRLGLGLFSIQEKLHAVGGLLRVISEPGKGASVLVAIPDRLPSKGGYS